MGIFLDFFSIVYFCLLLLLFISIFFPSISPSMLQVSWGIIVLLESFFEVGERLVFFFRLFSIFCILGVLFVLCSVLSSIAGVMGHQRIVGVFLWGGERLVFFYVISPLFFFMYISKVKDLIWSSVILGHRHCRVAARQTCFWYVH